ncbi:SMI1/KNR4 family protein [Glycomyces sp. NPDC047010]|uniref:SMI1/KNR4 family protein n=1 Tax=Glycomyces sp. NPDC047010 TaxID=3155023 RepID=UPI00340B2381
MTTEDVSNNPVESAVDALEWPVLLGLAIGAHSQIEALDTGTGFKIGVPRPAANDEQIVSAEAELGLRLPESYRHFLTHADGWEGAYFTLDLFGTPELHGQGHADRARELIETLTAEGDLEDSGLDVADLVPVAAGEGSDLVVIVGEGRPGAGTVIWFDGGEYGRYPDFAAFFTDLVAMLQTYAEGSSNP